MCKLTPGINLGIMLANEKIEMLVYKTKKHNSGERVSDKEALWKDSAATSFMRQVCC